MGRLGKLKRQAIQEANKKNLGIIEENHAGFSLGFANNGGLTLTEDNEAEEDYKRYLNQVANHIDITGSGSDYKNAEGETINIYNFDYEAATKLADEGVIEQSIFNNLTRLYKATQNLSETTEAEEVEEEGTGEEVNDVVEEQEDFGDGAEGEGESPLEQVTEGSFAKYNITLKD